MKKIICTVFIIFITLIGFANEKYTALLFNNQTEWTLSVYIDNKYGCTASPHSQCIVKVSTGFHIFSTANEESSVSESAIFKEGKVFQWTVFQTIGESI